MVSNKIWGTTEENTVASVNPGFIHCTRKSIIKIDKTRASSMILL